MTTKKRALAALGVVTGLAVVLALSLGRGSLPEGYLGRWYLAGTGGGIAGDVLEGATGASIVVTADNEIEHYAPDGSLVSTEKFTLSRGSSIFGSEDEWILDAGSALPRVIRLDDDTLSISENVYDGFGSWYTRTR